MTLLLAILVLMNSKIVLFDRDGTLIKDPADERVDSVEKIELFDDTVPALRALHEAGFSIILITNQAGISEGLLTTAEFARINNSVMELLRRSGITILDTFMCPHVDADKCDCRKPKPTMILEAAREHGFNIDDVYMIGDRESDINAGIAAGTKTMLVATGNTPVNGSKADHIVTTLTKAVDIILDDDFKSNN